MHSNGLRRQPQSETDSLVACKLQSIACKLQGAACKLQGAACKLQGVACELQGAVCKLQGAACELQGALANECPKVPPLLYIETSSAKRLNGSLFADLEDLIP